VKLAPFLFPFLLLLAACMDRGSSTSGGAVVLEEGSATEATSESAGSPTETATGGETAGSPTATAATAIATTQSSTEVRVVATGDVMLGRTVGEAIAVYGTAFPLDLVRDDLSGADLAVVNLEMALTERGTPAPKDFVFRAPMSYADALTHAGVDVAVLANNHAMDYGAEGLADTLTALDERGIAHVGAGMNAAEAYAPLVVERSGLRVAFVAFTAFPNDSISGFEARSFEAGPDSAGVAWLTTESLVAGIEAARQVGDIVIAVFHTGLEFQDAPNADQVFWSRLAIDSGATLLIGHHPHVLQGLELYGGGAIAYSLGNFVFDRDEFDLAAIGSGPQPTAVLAATVTADGLADVALLPFVVDPVENRPRPPAGPDEQTLVDQQIAYVNGLLPP
jgi:poly-gamma-glutamate synthesis protein (capsule biosynthesis protein)